MARIKFILAVIVCFSHFAIVNAQSSPPSVEKQKRTPDIHSKSATQNDQDALVSATIQALHSITHQEETTAEKTRAENEAFLTPSRIQEGLLIVGIAYSFLALLQWKEINNQVKIGNKTLIETRRAAEAATRSTEIAQQALIAGQRAFVSISSYNLQPVRELISGDIRGWRIGAVLQNTGNTPTRNMEIHVNSKTFDGQMPEAWDFPDLWGNMPKEEWVPAPVGIAPKGTASSQFLDVEMTVIKEVINRVKSHYFWAWVTYNDVFPDTPRHVTRFAVNVVISGDPSSLDKISFNLITLRKYNCTDEECTSQNWPAHWKGRDIAF